MMDDVISRQAAINAMGRAEWAINRINELPSAQPETHEERTETHACDCIERQAAIDALDKEYRCTDKSDDWDGLKTAMLIIENLPSAQPEPTAGDCWGCNCPKMNKEPKITFETLQSACKYRRVYSIKGRERKYVDCFYDDEVNECKNSNCPLMN